MPLCPDIWLTIEALQLTGRPEAASNPRKFRFCPFIVWDSVCPSFIPEDRGCYEDDPSCCDLLASDPAFCPRGHGHAAEFFGPRRRSRRAAPAHFRGLPCAKGFANRDGPQAAAPARQSQAV